VFLSWCGKTADLDSGSKDLTWDTEIIDKVDSMVDDIIKDEVNVNDLNTGALIDSNSSDLTQSTGNVWMANPASVNCENSWWKLEIKDWTWWQYWICTFDNWKQCEERAFMRWECVK